MGRELLLIPLFLLCAWIMRIFVKLVDRFVARDIIPEEYVRYESSKEMETQVLNEEQHTAGTGAVDAEKCILENTMPSTGSLGTVLDKFRRKSKVMHNSSMNTVQIGTARPTEIRFHHYE